MRLHRKSRAHCYLLPLLRRHRKRNCAGKSTTMRVILGLDAPDQGTALVGGCPYQSLSRPLTHVGALLDAAAGHSFHGSGSRSRQTNENASTTCWYVEPVSGFEPLTIRLQGGRSAY